MAEVVKGTVLELANVLEGLIDRMNPEAQGLWDFGVSERQSDEKHVADYAQTLSRTRKHFKIEGDMEIFGAFIAGNDLIALTGCSTTSAVRAEYIALLSPQNVRFLIQYIRNKETV